MHFRSEKGAIKIYGVIYVELPNKNYGVGGSILDSARNQSYTTRAKIDVGKRAIILLLF